MNIEDVYDAVERATVEHDFSGHLLLPATVCLALCDVIIDALTNEQRAAIEDARLFIAGHMSDEDRLKTSARVAEGLGRFQLVGDGKSREEAIQRLVWCTLVTTEGLTPIMGEFVVRLGERAGISADDIARAFRRTVQEFSV